MSDHIEEREPTMSEVPLIRVSANTTESHDPQPWFGGGLIPADFAEIRRRAEASQTWFGAACIVVLDKLAETEAALASEKSYAARWRFVRRFFDTDGDAEEGGGTWTSVIAVNEDDLHRATCREGVVWTVDELIDTAIKAPR